MKNIITFTILFFMINTTLQAQPINKIVGQYRIDGDATLIIFENHTFIIMAYATLIRGKVETKGNEVSLISNKEEEFMLYGRRNKSVKQGSKMMFYGFEKGDTYMGYPDKDTLPSVQPVFNSGANCFDYYNFLTTPQHKTFAFVSKASQWKGGEFGKVYSFDNQEQYNDFIVLYKEPYNLPVMQGKIVKGGRALVLSLGQEFNNKTFTIEKQPIEEEILQEFYHHQKGLNILGEEIATLLKQSKWVFANPSFRQYDAIEILDTNLYIPLNDEECTYISKAIYRPDGQYDTGDTQEYHNGLRIFKYTKVEPTINENKFEGDINSEPIFIVNCKEQEEYKDTLEEIPNEKEDVALTKTQEIEQAISDLKKRIEEDSKDSTMAEKIPLWQSCIADRYAEVENEKEAFRWYLLAAEGGEPLAQNNVGSFYLNGLGVEKNEELAAYWYEQSAKNNNTSAMCNLGYCYYKGIGVLQNMTKAFEWHKRAAQEGSEQGMQYVAVCYKEGKGVQQDDKKYFKWIKQLADSDYAPTYFGEVGYCYQQGKGVRKNIKKAIEYFMLGYSKGDEQSTYNLGVAYQKGISVKKDLEEAFQLFLVADNMADHFIILHAIGECYLKGWGTKKDLEKAAMYYTLSLDYIKHYNPLLIPSEQKMQKEMEKALAGELKNGIQTKT